jgi:hypothetical protein
MIKFTHNIPSALRIIISAQREWFKRTGPPRVFAGRTLLRIKISDPLISESGAQIKISDPLIR